MKDAGGYTLLALNVFLIKMVAKNISENHTQQL